MRPLSLRPETKFCKQLSFLPFLNIFTASGTVLRPVDYPVPAVRCCSFGVLGAKYSGSLRRLHHPPRTWRAFVNLEINLEVI